MPARDPAWEMSGELMRRLSLKALKTSTLSDLPLGNKMISLTAQVDGKTHTIKIDVLFSEKVLSKKSFDAPFSMAQRLFDVLHHLAQIEGFDTLRVTADTMEWAELGFVPSDHWLEHHRERLALLYLEHLGLNGKLLGFELPWLKKIVQVDHSQTKTPRYPLVVPQWEGEFTVDKHRAPSWQ